MHYFIFFEDFVVIFLSFYVKSKPITYKVNVWLFHILRHDSLQYRILMKLQKIENFVAECYRNRTNMSLENMEENTDDSCIRLKS